MTEKLKTDTARQKYRKRKSAVVPVSDIIKPILGFKQFPLEGIEKVKSEWQLVPLAYNARHPAKIMAG